MNDNKSFGQGINRNNSECEFDKGNQMVIYDLFISIR